jgi:iron complex transport system substrate-binding protein
LGRRVVIPANPRRIVSLAPNVTEILYALDLGDRVVAVTEFSDYPEEAREKPKVGTYVNSNIEKIIAFKPDLVIGTFGGTSKETVFRLEKLNHPVYVTKSANMDDVLLMIEKIGVMTGKEQRASQIVGDLKKRIEAVIDRVDQAPRPLVFLQINAKPLMTVGVDAFQNELVTLAGGRNLAEGAKARYPQYSIEDVVKRAPDVILISTMDRVGAFEEQKNQWMRWADIPAVRNNRIFFLDSDLIDRASPRIVDGLEAMARLLHPALF